MVEIVSDNEVVRHKGADVDLVFDILVDFRDNDGTLEKKTRTATVIDGSIVSISNETDWVAITVITP